MLHPLGWENGKPVPTPEPLYDPNTFSRSIFGAEDTNPLHDPNTFSQSIFSAEEPKPLYDTDTFSSISRSRSTQRLKPFDTGLKTINKKRY